MKIYLEPGYYSNLFEVSIKQTNMNVMASEKSNFSTLRDLKEEIKKIDKDIFVYAPERSKNVYGFGRDSEWLSNKGFRPLDLGIYDEPRLTSYIILQAILRKGREFGYQPDQTKDKGRYILFNWTKFKSTSNNNIKVFTGYDIRTIFLRNPGKNILTFMLIVDVKYKLKDFSNNPCNYRDIIKRFGNQTLKEVRQLQRDLISTGINTEVSRQRLHEDILPFVDKISEISFPISNNVSIEIKINPNPTRIIIGV
ncbi:MAG: hypothetical protein ABIL37_05925 [candidate division WOR-3 bacterium]